MRERLFFGASLIDPRKSIVIIAKVLTGEKERS
jgi:hypothetical protein